MEVATASKPRRGRKKAGWTPNDIGDDARLSEDEAGRQLSILLMNCNDGRDRGLLEAFRALARFTLVHSRGDLSAEAIDGAMDLALAHSNRLSRIVHAKEPRLDGKPRLTPMGSRLKLVMRQSDKIEEILDNVEAAFDHAADQGQTMKRQNTFSKALTQAKLSDSVPSVRAILKLAEYRQEGTEGRRAATPEQLVERLSRTIEQLAKAGIDTEGLSKYVIRHINPQLDIGVRDVEEDDYAGAEEAAFIEE